MSPAEGCRGDQHMTIRLNRLEAIAFMGPFWWINMQNESFELQLMCNSSLNREHYFEELSILRAIKVWG